MPQLLLLPAAAAAACCWCRLLRVLTYNSRSPGQASPQHPWHLQPHLRPPLSALQTTSLHTRIQPSSPLRVRWPSPMMGKP